MQKANQVQAQMPPSVCEQVHGPMGEGHTFVYGPVVPKEMAEHITRALQSGSPGCEAQYRQLHSINEKGGLDKLPCKIAYQGNISKTDDGTPEQPWYRSPLAQVPSNADSMFCNQWTPTIQMIKEVVEEVIGFKWNMVQIIDWAADVQNMDFHSENFKDLMPQSPIGVVNLGGPRELTMLKKDGFGHQQVELAPNTLLILDAETNALWNHTIQAKPGIGGPRITLVFRACWTNKAMDGLVYGQNCEFKTHQEAVEARDKKRVLEAMKEEQQPPKLDEQMQGQQQQAQEEEPMKPEAEDAGEKMEGVAENPLDEPAVAQGGQEGGFPSHLSGSQVTAF